jgi:hypothetical protein
MGFRSNIKKCQNGSFKSKFDLRVFVSKSSDITPRNAEWIYLINLIRGFVEKASGLTSRNAKMDQIF